MQAMRRARRSAPVENTKAVPWQVPDWEYQVSATGQCGEAGEWGRWEGEVEEAGVISVTIINMDNDTFQALKNVLERTKRISDLGLSGVMDKDYAIVVEWLKKREAAQDRAQDRVQDRVQDTPSLPNEINRDNELYASLEVLTINALIRYLRHQQ